MKTQPRMTFPLLVCLALTMSACNLGAPAEGPEGGGAPAPTATAPAQVPDTVTPASADPSPTTTAPVDQVLSEAEILQIVRTSLASFPWRMNQSVVVNATQQTTTTLTEAQSSTRGYNRSVQHIGSETITIETIIIDSLAYVKMTGSPAATYGLVDGQWTELPPGSPLLQLVDTEAIDPAKIADLFAVDFASQRGDGGADLLFEFVGSETVNDVATNIYETKGPTFTYRWWIGAEGTGDPLGRLFYKTTVELPEATRTITIEYDPSINIQPPIP